MSTSDFRLPHTVSPRRYDLRLEPDLASATFTGSVTIEVELMESVDDIVLHALDLDISEVSLEPVDAAGVAAVGARVALDADSETATLLLDSTAAPGLWELSATFTGELNDKLVGFYRSTFTPTSGTGAGTEQTLAVTQFEAPHARRAFPCFDEPEFKAVFAITLVVADDLLAVSNGGEVSRENLDENRVAVRFRETIPMSTYLVAFVIGQLEATDPIDVDGIPVRIISPPGQAHLTGFALETAAAALAYFTNYFDLPYPGDKLDLVAVPDFAFGAMENLGCVTFREVLLLVDPETATQPELQRVADVINHELAHMWFGDLVTMRWWNGIWLNEAFATFMEMRATDDQRPEWKRWVDFGLSRTAAFDVDALKATRPIEFDVLSPADAEGMFDLLTYEKGAAVVRMLEQYIGDEPFRDGIRRYMTEHRLKNTETTDLWDAIEASTDVSARTIMDSWIYQPGFPLVEASRDGDTLTLRQSRFLYDGSPSDALWQIPLRYRTCGADGSTVSDRVLLAETEVTVELGSGTDWVVVNAEGSSFVRVLYSASMMNALSAAASELDAVERYGLVDDHWAGVVAGRAEATSMVELAEQLANSGETDLSVWQRLVGALDSVYRIADAETRAVLGERLNSLYLTVSNEIDRTGASDERTRQLQALLFGARARCTSAPELVDRARELHHRYSTGEGDQTEALDPAMVGSALRVLTAHGTAEDFDQVAEGFRNSPTPQEELRHLNALAETAEEPQMAVLLEMTLDEVRSQNAPYVLMQALTNDARSSQVWDFVSANWEAIVERFPSSSIVRLLSGIRGITDSDLAAAVSGFLADHEVPSGQRTLDQHLERMNISVALAGREQPRLREQFLQ